MSVESIKQMPIEHKITGTVYYDKKTKKLCQYIPQGCCALLQHEDIDERAAVALIEQKVQAVLNYSASMSGKYPSSGTMILLQAHIPVYDIVQSERVSEHVEQGDHITIVNGKLWINKGTTSCFLTKLLVYTKHMVQQKTVLAEQRLNDRLKDFTENTLTFAQKEMPNMLEPILLPPLRTSFRNRSAVVVTRGKGYREDLKTLLPFIRQTNPVLIGVDGGADAILEMGYQPHIVIGDMDSVTEGALRFSNERIVHAYTDGTAPGIKIIQDYGLDVHVFPCFGTSEDAAQLLACEAGATQIITVGSHTCMLDFLEKGRNGMGSSLLVRLKIGDKLVDAKGIRHLNPWQSSTWRHNSGDSDYYHSRLSRRE